jgi:hypothetical protein
MLPGTRRLGLSLAAASLFAASTQAPARASAQVLSGIVGTAAGVAGGGYITLGIVVARAQFGHYLHDYYELFDWKSLPIVIGAGTGLTLGVWQPERLWSGLIVGSIGTAAGVGIGYVVGDLISERPEGKWAGAAIGGGVGMTVGALVGILHVQERLVPEEVRNAAVVPIGFRLRFE